MIAGNKYSASARLLIYYILTFIIFLFMVSIPSMGQGTGKQKRTRHRAQYMNQADSLRYIQSYLYVSEKGVKTEIEGATIRYYVVTDTGEVYIGEAITDPTGKAIGTLPADMDLPTDTSGMYSFLSRFEGDDVYKAKDVELDIRDLSLDIEYVDEDSVKFIKVQATDPKTGDKVEDVVINYYVERMFNPLKIGEEETDRRGTAELEFPVDLPGDENGNVTVLVRIEDDEVHGNFVTSEDLSWGIPIVSINTTHKRALWSHYAPLWMVITFVILMGLVWGHFVAITWMLRMIKRDEESSGSEILWDA